jgi:CBS domain-containing protein
MKVEDLMTRQVHCCRRHDPLGEPARIMWERDCGCVPVLEADGSGRVVGMITDRDVCMAAYTKGRPLDQIGVEEVMSRRVVSCGPRDDVKEAEAAMQRAQVRRLPVVDAEGRLVGLLALADLAGATAGERRGRKGAVTQKEVVATLEAICRPTPAPSAA